MRAEQLIETYPRLFHMAEADAWPSIQRHGLLSTAALLELFEVSAAARHALLAQRRPESVMIAHPTHGRAVVRDNGPLHEGKLAACLTDMTVPDFLGLINAHVFFWPGQDRLDRLFRAPAYVGRPHLILELETASVVAAHADEVRLSPINSGSTIFKAQPRGSHTFASIGDYDFDAWRRKRSAKAAVAEVCVLGGVPDVDSHLLRAYVRDPHGSTDEVAP